jgi:nitroimidazol reductase NimA-like FMN-containing flavoprotein (pyridoxamine 5'-phosphate oxidase superfamily)
MTRNGVSGAPGSMSELSQAECYRRLETLDVGRVAVCGDEGPTIIPVNYLVDDTSIILRTAPYTTLADHALGPMAFEADQLEPALRYGWSIVVIGHAMPVEDVDESIMLRSSGRLTAWAPGPRNLFIRLTPRRVTGREIG